MNAGTPCPLRQLHVRQYSIYEYQFVPIYSRLLQLLLTPHRVTTARFDLTVMQAAAKS